LHGVGDAAFDGQSGDTNDADHAMTQHLLVFLTIIALVWLISRIHGQSDREEERKPVAVTSAPKIHNKGKRRRIKKLLAHAGH
jgi:hypothetical protein